jgi:hypothetical protein
MVASLKDDARLSGEYPVNPTNGFPDARGRGLRDCWMHSRQGRVSRGNSPPLAACGCDTGVAYLLDEALAWLESRGPAQEVRQRPRAEIGTKP